MLKTLLVAINAKYIHSSLAVRSLAASLKGAYTVDIAEYTINNNLDFILEDIYNQAPKVIGFSCYLWNINMIFNLSRELKKLITDAKIFLGGPEASFDSEEILKKNNFIDVIIRGEGEKTFLELMEQFQTGENNLYKIKGISYRKGRKIFHTPERESMPMGELPVVYSGLEGLKNKIIYYETQRGCPFNCQFCMSSVEKSVRFMPRERVVKDLDFFLENKVPQVKLVDRTFNCNKEHSRFIWQYLIEHDNKVTNFHMEIAADLIEKEDINILKGARPGLFQFEAGVQSLNPDTLNAVCRKNDFEKIKQVIKEIKANGNIHLHLDLIAGLPLESYLSFKSSFNGVYELKPEQLQLGFLKLLKGSGLREKAEEYGIIYRDKAPYEVLYTNDISYLELERLKAIADIVENFYNSGRALNTLKYLESFFETPFDIFEAFANFWKKDGFHKAFHNKLELYDILYSFCSGEERLQKANIIKEVLKLDMFLSENIKKLPSWLNEPDEELKSFSRKFFNNRDNISYYLPNLLSFGQNQLSRMCKIEDFSFDPFEFMETGNVNMTKVRVLFNYYSGKDILNSPKILKIQV